MIRMAAGLLLGMLLTALAAYAEEISISTYYPSPRGVYDELRANRLILTDAATKRTYQLTMNGGRLVITDQQRDKGFVVIDLGGL